MADQDGTIVRGPGHCPEYLDFFLLVDLTQVTQSRVGLGREWVRSDPDGSDRTYPKYQIRELVAPRIAGWVGIM